MSHFQVLVEIEGIAVEATELGLDEVEDFFVPSELFEYSSSNASL
jgi:predicted nucleotidyltransferase